MTVVERPWTGNADDMGETWDWFAVSVSSKVVELDPEMLGGCVVLGVCGAALVTFATFPMNHD